MVNQGKLKDPRVCRIFFSSPFGGMEDEREELTRKYFPQIHHLCNSHGVQFVAVDMRWGITKEAGESAQVINICLRELDRSDMFVGFFGQRYGWHGADDELLQNNFDNAVSRYPWLDNFRDKSVTELEFLHGHLNSPGTLPACIYFRDKIYDDKIRNEAEKKGDKKGIFKYSPESETSVAFMEDLKKRVKATEDKMLDLDLKYPDPIQVAERMFKCMWKELKENLLVGSDVEELSPREQVLIDHDAFISQYLTAYCGNNSYLHQLNTALDSGKLLLVYGVSGGGKTALLSNWIEDLKKTEDFNVIYHFIGCSPSSTRPINILQRLLDELDHCLPVEKREGKKDSKEKKPASEQELLQDLQTVMDKISSGGKKTVLVIDALDKILQSNKTEKPLYWLPQEVPENISLVVSTAEDETLYNQLVEERQFNVLQVQPLDNTMKQQICTKSLMLYGKELSPDQLERVINAHQTHNPLFLMITVSEIIVFGYFRLLDKKIDSLISCNSIEGLFEECLKRFEEDYNVSEFTDLVQKVMLAIFFSHEGISEVELKGIFNIPDSLWSPLYFAVEKYVIQHAGLLNFGFSQMKNAVKKRYLENTKFGNQILKKMILYFEKKKEEFHWSVSPTDYDVKRCSIELAFLKEKLGDKVELLKTITDLKVYQCLDEKYKYEIIDLWKASGYKISEIIDNYLKNFDVLVAKIYLDRQECPNETYKDPPGIYASELLTNLRLTLGLVQQPKQGVKIMKKQIQILENCNGHMDESTRQIALVRCEYFLATQYVEMEDYAPAEKIHHKNIEKLEKLKDEGNISQDSLIVLAMTYNDIGVVLVSRREYKKAEEYFWKSMEIEVKRNMKPEVAECWCNIGLCRLNQDDKENALKFFQKTLKAYEELYFGQLNHHLGAVITNIGLAYRRLGQIEKAEEYYFRSLKIKAKALGWDNPDVAFAYMNLSVIEQIRKNMPKAMEYIEKAEEIFKKRDADLYSNENYRKVFENRVLYLAIQEKYEDAEEDYEKILNVLIEKDLMDYCLKGLHIEMFKYYVRSGNLEKAEKTAVAILSQKNLERLSSTDFVHLDYLDAQKPFEERPKREYKFTLEYASELWPQDGDVGRRLAINTYIPANNTDKLLKHLEKVDKNVDGLGAMTYVHASNWCLEANNHNLAIEVLKKGHEIYPDSLDIVGNLTNILRDRKDYEALVELLVPVTNKVYDSSYLYIAGYSSIMLAQFDQARELLQKIISQEDDPMKEKATGLFGCIDQWEMETKKHREENKDSSQTS